MEDQKNKQIKVLFVEDNPGDARLILEMIKEAGYSQFKIGRAESLKEAFKLLDEMPFDAILSDLGLPDSFGLDTFSKLYEKAPKIPIIVMTGLNDEVTGTKAVRDGAQDYLVKGQVDSNLLVRALRYAIERKQVEEEVRQKNKKLETMGNELRELNDSLEQKVKKRTSEIEKLLKHKDEFISQLGHDLKTPLTPLTALLPIIQKNEENLESKNLLQVCIQNVDYIKNLVTNTLQLAKINSKITVFNLKEIRLSEIAESVLNDYQTEIEDKYIRVENKINSDAIVKADAIQLKEVFNNLVTNAVKFMEDGGALTIEAKQNGDGFTTISVKDTGIGITEEQKLHLFEEFYKADQSRHDLNSTGLGLSICKRIVENHGGKIWVESLGEGRGTTFYFKIPNKIEIDTLTILS